VPADATALATGSLEPLEAGMESRLQGLRMRELREAAGVSQGALAVRLGELQSNVSRWERGKMEIPASRIPDICEIIGCTLADFFQPPVTEFAPRGRGRPPKTPPAPSRPGRRRGPKE
jgi:DNA-binding Xre family transcriptional regulator